MADYSPPPQLEAKAEVLRLLGEGFDMYSKPPDPRMGEAINQLIAESPALAGGEAVAEGLGTGTWQVFWAPHIASMALTMQAQFKPILYKFGVDGSLVSNVQYKAPLLGNGWLSASGRMFRKDSSTVEISFDTFWMDFGDTLREQLPADGFGSTNILGFNVPLDSMLTSLGRATFFPQLALFPVKYMDDDLAVFEFPPLQSKIAITRLDPVSKP